MGWGGNGKGQDRLQIKDPSKVVWLGDVPQGTTYQELLPFVQQVGQAKWAQVLGKTAAVGFATAEDATSAAASLNGANFNGSTLQADMWTGKASGGGGGGKGQSWGGKGQVWKPNFQKSWGGDSWGGGGGSWGKDGGGGSWGKGKGKGKGKGGSKIHPQKTVWLGNVPEGTTFQQVLELAKSVSNEAKWAEVFKGTAAVGFASEEAAGSAMIALNGAMLGASAIIADAWSGKEKQA